MQKLDGLLSNYIDTIIKFLPEVVTSLFILAVGMFAIKFLKKLANKLFLEKRIDPTFASFLIDILIWGLRILLFVIIASKLGIQTSSFVAIVGAMTLAIGLSLQGSLSNFAGGVLIILFKPFRIGDTIEAQGEIGKVLGIHIFSTQIQTSQNNVVYLPNGILSNGKIKNLSQNNLRKLEINLQTTLLKNTSEFIDKLQASLEQNNLILTQPAPHIYIKDLLDTKITYTVHAWVESSDSTTVTSYILYEAKKISDAL
ncbi:mechanosensitive ion channel family protein [Myroides pelagicus]|uniref:Mechanosensitive ion channel n=1 Tax=Myroides pelagicus TaxID=270914 RepID=A0A7K1GJH4_9FLAO|nr:mechanosensitive ion channel domain-containing protein [Myroides pelagicus]MEC4112859.1 mechanosensitive ion channel domain-containing protein [Myroides pelagicus]MTH28669.1 mechanosensitive ion channel [Myroides pelagicus]